LTRGLSATKRVGRGHGPENVTTCTNAAREISASNLHRRLALEGPDDELKHLADTFDELLGRLEASFAAQRQFVANASHELRTPLTLQRTLLEVALTDPNASAETLRRTCEQLLTSGGQHERLIEALLTLSRSQRGLDQRERFDLAAVSDTVLAVRRPEATLRGLSIRATLEPAETPQRRARARRSRNRDQGRPGAALDRKQRPDHRPGSGGATLPALPTPRS
jgi:signal transduction histidine kinase